MLCSSEHHNPPANFDPVWRDNGGHAVFHLNEKLGRGEPERKKKEKKKKNQRNTSKIFQPSSVKGNPTV